MYNNFVLNINRHNYSFKGVRMKNISYSLLDKLYKMANEFRLLNTELGASADLLEQAADSYLKAIINQSERPAFDQVIRQVGHQINQTDLSGFLPFNDKLDDVMLLRKQADESIEGDDINMIMSAFGHRLQDLSQQVA